MRTTVATPRALPLTRATARIAAYAVVLATVLGGACAGDGPSVAPRQARDGQIVHVTGTSEFTYRPARGATPQVLHRGTWTSSGTMTHGVARPDFQLRALGRRTEHDDDPGTSSATVDSAALARILDKAGALLLPALAVDADARMAQFGTGSVVESVLRDAGGGEVRVAATSDYRRGPLTDVIVVQNGRPARHVRFDWERRDGAWHMARARATVLLPGGGVMSAESRVNGSRFAAVTGDSGLTVASLAHRIEELRFGALAKRLVLPAAAQAQAGVPTDPYRPGGFIYDCSIFRNSVVPASAPCVAYGLNGTLSDMQGLLSWLPVAIVGRLVPILLTGGADAVAAELASAGIAVESVLVSQLITALVSISVGLYAYHYTECRVYHKEAADQCKASDPRPGGGSGYSDGPFADTGTVREACGLSCDPSRRGIIDDWRNGIRAQD